MTGHVNSRRTPVLRLRIFGPLDRSVDIEVVVDTGYTGTMSVPLTIVTGLGLVRSMTGTATMADGTVSNFDVFNADIEWFGRTRPVLVSAIGGEALIGMTLLEGLELRVQAWPGGDVEIREPA